MSGAFRRAIGTVVTLALVGAAIGFYALSPNLTLTSGPGPVTTAEPAPTRTTIESASPTPTPSPAPTRTPTRTPESTPDPNLPPGPGGRTPGIRLTVTPTAHGAFDVIEAVRMAEPVTQLSLALPDVASAGRILRGKRAVAGSLQIRAAGRRIKVPTTTLHRATVISVGRPGEVFELRYRLRGVTVINKPSSEGRAFGAVGPLVTNMPQDLPVAITVRGHSVRNLTCPCLPMQEWACAAGPRPNVRVNRNLARRDALVAVQLDLTAIRVGAPR
jgi:hypothetical protein